MGVGEGTARSSRYKKTIRKLKQRRRRRERQKNK